VAFRFGRDNDEMSCRSLNLSVAEAARYIHSQSREAVTVTRSSSLALLALCLVFLFAVLSCGQSKSSPTPTPTTTTSAVDPLIETQALTPPFFRTMEESLPLPSLLQAGASTTDPTFPGTTILRLTDATTGSADVKDNINNPINNTGVQVQYSYWPVFNKNSTRFHVVGIYPINAPPAPGTTRSVFFTFDPTTMQVTSHMVLEKVLPSSGALLERSDMIWSGTKPDVIYGDNTVTQLWEYNVANNDYTLIKDFAVTNDVQPGEGIKQMSKSLDDNVFAFSLIDAATHVPKGYLVWRRDTLPLGPGQILARTLVNDLDEVQVDKSGQFLTVGYNSGDVDIRTLATNQVIRLTANNDGFSHHDSGHGTIFSGGFHHDFRYRQLALPTSPTNPKSLIPGSRSLAQQNHFSMLADNELWALVSRYSFPGAAPPNCPCDPFDSEIFQVATDSSGRVRHLGHHRSVTTPPSYDELPKANISRDGRFVAFTSNWGQAGGRRDVYIVIIPPAPTN